MEDMCEGGLNKQQDLCAEEERTLLQREAREQCRIKWKHRTDGGLAHNVPDDHITVGVARNDEPHRRQHRV